jgi:aspartyl-tRNA(Asn)/glutamyl-tRNA(Gln) amidotransferase subunit B
MTEDWLARIRAELPELPQARRKRFVEDYGLSASDVDVLLADRALADYFEALVEASGDARAASVWVSQYVMRELRGREMTLAEFPVSAEALGDLIKLVAAKTVSISAAQEKVLAAMIDTGKSAKAIVDEQGLAQVSDTGALDAAVDAVIGKFPDEVAEFRAGKEGVINFLMGMVMKETRGKANPQMVRQLLQQKLS